ncbi:hypothetical protein CEXT_246341 [Caerostris extrusa]|uniref:Uncharacterized protein n=1 Tax=Caerostris extrusa TaxID=172846 RepID=A0AAV4UT81_CAEEX|nr:hypothetical protein CEXT_246341 [Caerostris extrusa]
MTEKSGKEVNTTRQASKPSGEVVKEVAPVAKVVKNIKPSGEILKEAAPVAKDIKQSGDDVVKEVKPKSPRHQNIKSGETVKEVAPAAKGRQKTSNQAAKQ